MAIRHVQRLVFVAREWPRVLPLLNGHLLYPSDSVEAPSFEIRSNRFLNPSKCAAAVLLSPDVDILWVTQTCRVDVIEPNREEWNTFWGNQSPVIFPVPKCKETMGFGLSRLDLLSLYSLRTRCHGQPCSKDSRLL